MWRILHYLFGYHYVVLDIIGSQYVRRMRKSGHNSPVIEYDFVMYYLNKNGTISTFVKEKAGYKWEPLTFKLEDFWEEK